MCREDGGFQGVAVNGKTSSNKNNERIGREVQRAWSLSLLSQSLPPLYLAAVEAYTSMHVHTSMLQQQHPA
jgi:hypothetical protein